MRKKIHAKMINISRKSSDRDTASDDQDPGFQRRNVSTPSKKHFSFFGRKRTTSSASSCRSAEFESLDEDTASGAEGLVNLGARGRNLSTSSRGSRIRSFQHQSTCSADSGVFHDSVKSYRVLILGPTSVGKTSIVRQLLHRQISAQYQPTLQEMYTGDIELGGSQSVLNIEDTGQNFVHEFPAMAEVSLQAADGVLIVFSVAEPSTFEEVS